MKNIIILLLFISILFSYSHAKGEKFKDPYCGQKPPGKIPEVFAPGFISTDRHELNSVFSPEGDEFYYSIYTRHDKKYSIWYSKIVNGKWIEPEVVSFSGEYTDVDMAFSPDGKRLYFCSKRPLPDNPKPEYYVWYVDRMENGLWSEPIMMDYPVNTVYSETYPTFTNEGKMYLASNREGTTGSKDVYSIDYVNEEFTTAVNLGDSINTEYGEGDTFVAPDESYLITSCWGRPEGKGMDISFKREDGSWSKKVNIEKTLGWEIVGGCPYVSPDGKYFFFTSRGDIYWVDAKIIEKLKPKDL